MRKAHVVTTTSRRLLRAAETRATEPASVESIRHSLIALRRLFQRRELVQLWESAFGERSQLDYTDLRLLDAVRVAQASDSAQGATVGELARLLGVDPSRASRQVAQAVAKEPTQRVPTAGEFAARLRATLPPDTARRFAAAALEKLEEGQAIAMPKGKVTANGA